MCATGTATYALRDAQQNDDAADVRLSLGLPFSQVAFLFSQSEKEAADQYKIQWRKTQTAAVFVAALGTAAKQKETRWREKEQA